MNSFFATVLVCVAVALLADAQLRVAIHRNSCNTAALNPSYDTRVSISQQLNVDCLMQADLLDDDNFTTAILNNYDVVYLGCGGKDLNLKALSRSAASALVNFVSEQGKGLVISATTPTAFSDAQDVIQNLLPFTSMDTAWAKTESGNTIPLMTINRTSGHFITSYNITANTVAPLAYAFFVQGQPKAGWTSLASVDPYTAKCCIPFGDCDNSLCTPYANQGILVSSVGNGRVAYINFAYCGYEMFQPHNLRKGTINQLFLNMFYWTSGKCKGINECNNNGACIGSLKCYCSSGWSGQSCNIPSCEPGCQHGGSCTGPNLCSCPDHYTGNLCEYCAYPWAGPDCTSVREIQNPSFEQNVAGSAWQYSKDNSTLLRGTTDGVSPKDGSQMLVFSGNEMINVSVYLYIQSENGDAPYISFYYRGSVSSNSKLMICVDDDTLWTGDQSVSSWTNIFVDLKNYSSASGVQHYIKIVADMKSGDKFYVDLVKDMYPVCSPECDHGSCVVNSSNMLHCVCDEHYQGVTCSDPICGDGVVAFPETCDDGNTIDNDGCSSKCLIEDGWTCDVGGQPCHDTCGDGKVMDVNNPTVCDDGNRVSGDGCSYDCVVEFGYTCTRSRTDYSVCHVNCGDGIIFGLERCDDGNTIDNDGCNADCSKVNASWQCTYKYAEQNECVERKCGNGRKTSDEQCDDGLCDGIHGCTTACKIMEGFYVVQNNSFCPKTVFTSVCGDGITALGLEECDSGIGCNTVTCTHLPGYECTTHKDSKNNYISTCNSVCGDGIVVPGEECDNMNQEGCENCQLVWGYYCIDKSNCTEVIKFECGNGILEEPFETCDVGNKQDVGCVNCNLTPGYACDSSHCWTVCGDGVLTPDELCDCGDKNHSYFGCNAKNGQGYSCSENCSYYAPELCTCVNVTDESGIMHSECRTSCGNGARSGAEQCDDNNTENGDGCSSRCYIEDGWECETIPYEGGLTVCHPICHDGEVHGNETCDEGAGNSEGCIECQKQYGYVCPQGKNCHCEYNDGIMCKYEDCDDAGESCSSLGTCGCVDGKVKDGWECRNETGPKSLCLPVGCGNGILNFDEECDDGNSVSGDGCSADCKLENRTKYECIVPESRLNVTVCRERRCGDGIVTSDEECDDGNNLDNDGCSKDCKIEVFWLCDYVKGHNPESSCYETKVCGDGYHTSREECDDGNLIDGDGCSSICTLEDGFLCVDTQMKLTQCHPIYCGDGKVEGPEKCDDGNVLDGDGCDSHCQIEPGFKCSAATGTSICRSQCGDGRKASNEECDDGNLVGDDGCSPLCTIEHGYTCFINYSDSTCSDGSCTSLCFATCGDGIVALTEECDDGNIMPGDGCSPDCKVEYNESTKELWFCEGEPSVCNDCNGLLPELEYVSSNISCPGSYTGVIDILSVHEGLVTKVWKDGDPEPSSYKSSSHYSGLEKGVYKVKITTTAILSTQSSVSSGGCYREATVDISAPDPFVLKTKFDLTSCSKSEGWINWTVKGGTKPYRFFFANRSEQTEGHWDEISIPEFVMGVPVVMDANNCTRKMTLGKDDQWPNATFCEEDAVPYLLEGSILLGSAFVVAIVAAIVYSCWSAKKYIPRGVIDKLR